MDDINWISILLAISTPFIVGLIYFHRNAFGKSLPIPNDTSNSKRIKIIAVTTSVIFIFFLSFFLLNFNNSGINQEGVFDTFKHGVWHGTFIAVTVAFPVIIINGVIGKRKLKEMLIYLFYWLITLALMGGILDAMNHWENVIIP